MTCKGGITRSQLDRQWPHHVALPAEAVRGLRNAETVRGFAASLSPAPLTYHGHDGDRDYVVFCFPPRRPHRPSPSGSAASCCQLRPERRGHDRPRRQGADRGRDLRRLERLGAGKELLAIVGSWRDTLDDTEVLELLQDYNAGQRTLGSAGAFPATLDRTSR